MRIAFILNEFPKLSITFIINQITGLIDRGHEVDIYAFKRGNIDKMHSAIDTYKLLDRTTYSPLKPRNFRVRLIKALHPLLAHPFTNPVGRMRVLNFFKHGKDASSLTLLYKVMAFLPQRKYDIIHCHFGYTALRVLDAMEAGILHGKLLTTFHGADVNVYPRQHGTQVYEELFKRGHAYTANSKFTAGRAERLGCPTDRMMKLPVGLDMNLFSFAERTLEPTGEIRVLTVGNLVEVKGIEYGIRAIANILPVHGNVRYKIVGAGPLRDQLEKLAIDLGVAGHVEFLGGQTQDEVRRLYSEAHLFMLPGVVGRDGAEEAQGLVLAEAQATGLPIVATRVGGIPESVVDLESGFLVGERDVGALAERLVFLIENPQLWPQMGRAGRAFVEQHFDIEKLNNRLVEIYHNLLEEG